MTEMCMRTIIWRFSNIIISITSIGETRLRCDIYMEQMTVWLRLGENPSASFTLSFPYPLWIHLIYGCDLKIKLYVIDPDVRTLFIIIITSRNSPPSAIFHCNGALLTTSDDCIAMMALPQ